MAHYRGKDSSSSEEFVKAKQRYIILLDKKEAFWKQRAKQHWLAEGDTNTRFFHSMASARQRRNRITRLNDDFGKWHSTDNGLEELIVDYFETLFKSDSCSNDACLYSFMPSLSGSDNEFYLHHPLKKKFRRQCFPCILISLLGLMA